MTVEDLIDTFYDSGLQEFAIYDLDHHKEIYRGPGDELTDTDILYSEICSIDCIEKGSDIVTINISTED